MRIASALAGVAGVLVGMSFNSISPYMGVDMGIKGLAAMLLGGLGNVYGAMLGGLVIGVVEVISVAYLVVVLPRRLRLFRHYRRAAVPAARHLRCDRSRRGLSMLDPYVESILIFTGINIVLALSLYLPVSAGLLSLGQGGFMAIGAYTSGLSDLGDGNGRSSWRWAAAD